MSSLAENVYVIYLPIYIVCSVGVLANLMLLIAFIKDPLKCFRNSATYLVANLAFSDVLVSVTFAARTFVEIAVFLQYFAFYSSMLTIFSIAIDRYLMISFPFKHRILMSGKKMGIWITFIWFLSFVHPVKSFFSFNVNDSIAKLGVGAVLVLFTAVVYAKTYFALQNQARSMMGKKTTFVSMRNQCAFNKSISMESETRVQSEDGERAQNQHDCAQNWSERAKCQSERAQSSNKRAVIQNHRAEDCERADIESDCAKCQSKRAQNLEEPAVVRNHCSEEDCERAQTENERVGNRSECAQGLYDCAENQDDRAEELNDRVHNHLHAETEHESAKNNNQRAECKNKRADSQNGRVQGEVDLLSNQTLKSFQVTNNREQKFLNTIIIIAGIAVVTVIPGTVYSMIHGTVDPTASRNRIPFATAGTIFGLNFAVNPFVYCLRLKKYRKTFKIVYGCKH